MFSLSTKSPAPVLNSSVIGREVKSSTTGTRAIPLFFATFLIVLVGSIAIAQSTPQQTMSRFQVGPNAPTCQYVLVDWMGGGGGYSTWVCDGVDMGQAYDPAAYVPADGIGVGLPAAAAERQRQVRCFNNKGDYASKNCASKADAPPLNDYGTTFTLPNPLGILDLDAFRSTLREFQTAVFNDGNAWFNFTGYRNTMLDTCTITDTTGEVPVAGWVPGTACKALINYYFGVYSSGGGYAGFAGSLAASDARNFWEGKACLTLAAQIQTDQCN
jgi:hypothetical protein